MVPIHYILSAFLLASAILTGILAVLSFNKRHLPGGTSLAFLLIATSIYSAGYAMELTAPDQHTARLWLHVEYFGLPFLPPLMIITITNILYQTALRPKLQILLFVIPLITFILEITNDHHHLYYSSVQFVSRGPLSVLELGKGPWYWIQTAYVNLAIIVNGIMSIIRLITQQGQLKRLAGIIVMSLMFPWAGHLIYITGINPYGMDTAPFSLSVTMLILSYAFFRNRMLDILPVAYDTLFHILPDGVLVVDEKNLVVGHNPSAEKILDTHIIDIPTIREVVPEFPETCTQAKIEGNCIIEKKLGDKSRWIDVRGNAFQIGKNRQSRIITLRDITEMKMLELSIKANEKKMRDEISVMRNIQATFMPDFSMVKSYDIASIYLPAGDLSGDFIDGFFVDDDTYQIVICDVMGHGLTSAYLGMEIRSLFRAFSPGEQSPAKILAEVNNTLTIDFSHLMYFATAAVVHIHLHSNRINYSSAGHLPALHRSAEGTITETGFTGALMGLTANNVYEDISLDFASDDCFLMYTDGITEAREKGIGEMFEKERLQAEFSNIALLPPRDALHTLVESIFEFIDYTPTEDDISLVCFKLRG